MRYGGHNGVLKGVCTGADQRHSENDESGDKRRSRVLNQVEEGRGWILHSASSRYYGSQHPHYKDEG